MDGVIFILYIILLAVGLLMVTTASSYRATAEGSPTYYYLMRQALFAGVGFIALIFIFLMNAKFWRKKWMQIFIYVVILSLLLVTAKFGRAINGAQGWLFLGPLSLQPVEFAKPALILLVAHFLSKREVQDSLVKAKNPFELIKQFWLPLGAILFWLVIIFTFPDVGGVLILGSLLALMILNAGLPISWLRNTVFGIIFIYFVVVLLFRFVDLSHIDSYQIQRFTAFIDPFQDARDAGLQLVYGYYAFANGGIFGLGAGNSIQKLGYLPEAHNDFIMAIVGEEFGMWGVLAILFLYFGLVLYIFYRAQKMKRTYHQLILLGVGAYFLIQAFVNLGGVLGLIPLTGVTFPFMSYGGSSLLVTSIMIGIALNILRTDKQMYRASLQEKLQKEERKV
ncbi:FtsW/RodA/SpoVE family cell cycle protein [Aerococcus agrisoli]|uniref:Probable peptidoglycan glycosyltransferase FtsW n=2 Tax=Aerococcus agrisoli TaxID=2487350 RepID=A0A3N4GEM9_9LACT|nr:FtsW/RodA/SpoVE family cell cycle protein [Aerococcus agrisoli]